MTTAVPPPAPNPLSFPPATFQKLAPKTFLERHLQSTPATRPSGRSPDTFRTPSLHTNSLSHAHGSAVVRTGDTAVVCGVRGEVLSLTAGVESRVVVLRSGEDRMDEDGDEIRERGLVVTNLEMGTGCTRDYHPGPPTDFAQAVTARLQRLLLANKLISPQSLRILDPNTEKIKAYWVLYIDVVVISLDGNVLDAAWASILAALRSTKLPQAYWDLDNEGVVCYPEASKYKSLCLKGLAFTASFAVINLGTEKGGKVILSDPDEFEEGVCEERVMVCALEEEKVGWIEKGGGVGQVAEVMECVRRATERFKAWEQLFSEGLGSSG
ncbi:ribosomal protein S5 domain 2-like protein [Choiromyces venosus 120613-1]|uniref:Ribosomal RNA-processing protein 43 n=1 Tax=Choiromyces venosus 120613-1 TaxID=1336337 RepID=A0A3N4JYC3_9PEZI|nr:ribosomal protein S5 domain 2-like protein [Choiromyces venosus 120613-1]